MQEVGLTKGAFYSHFKSKGDLLLNILERYKKKSLEEMIRAADKKTGDVLDKLNHIISFNARFAARNEDLCVFLTFLSTELKTDVDFEPALTGIYGTYRRFITRLIQEGIRQGLLKRDLDPELTAISFIALHDGVLHQWIVHRGRIDAEQYVRTFRKIFLSGVVNEKPGKRKKENR